jgi:hypothetical protein
MHNYRHFQCFGNFVFFFIFNLADITLLIGVFMLPLFTTLIGHKCTINKLYNIILPPHNSSGPVSLSHIVLCRWWNSWSQNLSSTLKYSSFLFSCSTGLFSHRLVVLGAIEPFRPRQELRARRSPIAAFRRNIGWHLFGGKD